ncbi:hypothetical protein [Pontibacter akesuensis]|uniref:Uncharacterized protein n=1 Tax=Pontibacter akesuensis TaxID=388950 RepID=A0A1I7JG73_9BACT|nr:hypothetical protein [Pontibacter akesuensis]GHA70176.1 hypothetical protein GCM10007389_24290 [Pontibacter akesuensis]SFU84187.1 hypothetical protein SAMN04487941_2840 [Pontibacter akesuensis]
MRVVADIPNPDMKVTLLNWNGKYLIKLEKGDFEQTYKISEMDVMGDAGAKELLDEDFLEATLNRFNDMRDAFVSTVRRNNG